MHVIKAQDCDPKEFVIKNGDQTVLRIDDNAEVHACGVNVCEQLQQGVQQLSLEGSNLMISNGNSVDLSDFVGSYTAGFVKLVGDQCIAPGLPASGHLVLFNQVEFDLLNEWNATEHAFVVKETGIYQVTGQCWLNYVDNGANGLLIMIRNGAAIQSAGQQSVNDLGSIVLQSTMLAALNAGDKIDLRCRHMSTTDKCISGEYTNTFLSIYRIR